MTRDREREYIRQLNAIGVRDVYFSKGTLYVVNAYDIPAIEEYLETNIDIVRWQLTSEDEYMLD
jgi:hypothetical protein